MTVVGASALNAATQDAASKGYAIAREAADRDRGYGDFTVSGKMILRDNGGHESQRIFGLRSLEGKDVNKTLLVFDWPGDIRDAALLTYSYKDRDDDQWLFLPAINRVKRISGSGRSVLFVGSEFAYEDMINQDVSKFTYKWIENGPCPTAPDVQCHIVDRFPSYESGYSRQEVAFDIKELRVISIDYFDCSGARAKTLTASGYQLYKGHFWRPVTLRMANHITGRSSDLLWSKYQFDVGLVGRAISVNALQHVR